MHIKKFEDVRGELTPRAARALGSQAKKPFANTFVYDTWNGGGEVISIVVPVIKFMVVSTVPGSGGVYDNRRPGLRGNSEASRLFCSESMEQAIDLSAESHALANGMTKEEYAEGMREYYYDTERFKNTGLAQSNLISRWWADLNRGEAVKTEKIDKLLHAKGWGVMSKLNLTIAEIDEDEDEEG